MLRLDRRISVMLLVGGAAAVCGLAAGLHPLSVLAALPVLAAGMFLFTSPDLTAGLGIFLIFSNFAVIAIRFHGVPKVLGLAIPLLLAVPMIGNLLTRRRRLTFHPLTPLLMLLFAVQIMGALFSRHPRESMSGAVEFFLEGLLIFLLVTSAFDSHRALRSATWALLLAGFAVSLVPIFQQITGSENQFGGLGQFTADDIPGTAALEMKAEGRMSGPIGEPNRFAQNMLMLLPLGYILTRTEGRPKLRAAAWFLTGISGIGFLLAFSRGGIVALALVIVLMVAMKILKTRHVVLLGMAGAFVAVAFLPKYLDRMGALKNLVNLQSREIGSSEAPEGSIKGRATEMLAAALVFTDHPVVGVGPGMFKYYSQEYGNELGIRKLKEARQAHSLFLDIAAENGALGLLCFLALSLATLQGLIRGRRRCLASRPVLADYAAGYFLALTSYLFTGLFLHLSFIRFFYLMLGLGAAAAQIALSERTDDGTDRSFAPSPEAPPMLTARTI